MRLSLPYAYVLLLPLLASCRRSGPTPPTEQDPQPAELTLEQCLDDRRWPRPQGREYRGGLAERVEYVFDVQRGAAQARLAGASCRKEPFTVRLEEVPSTGPSELRVYRAYLPDGRNLCEGQTYVPTADERARAGCPPSGSCPALDALTGTAHLVEGAWRDGAWSRERDGRSVFTLSCLTGAAAKCARWGYVPGHKYAGSDLTPYFQACVHAARARFLDRDDSFTCPGTEVDIYDRLGIQQRTPGGPPLESLWNENGPSCIAHTRHPACEARLSGAYRRCVDPAGPGGSWRPDSSPGAFIAIASAAKTGTPPCVPEACRVPPPTR